MMAATRLPPAAAPVTTLPPATVARLAATAQRFEAQAIGQLLQPMFDTVDTSSGPFGGGAGEQTWRPMMVSEIAKRIAAAGGIGLAAPVLQALIHAQEQKEQARR